MNPLPPLPDSGDDNRPKYQRIAHANFLQGYRLFIERPRRFAEWRKPDEPPHGIPFEMAMRVAWSMAADFGHLIVRIGIGTLRDFPFGSPIPSKPDEPMTQPEEQTAPIVLAKRRYKQYELAELAGISKRTLRDADDDLTIERGGDWSTAPKFYVVDDTLIDWLQGRGLEVKLSGDALGLVRVVDDETAADASGDGQAGTEPEATDPLEGILVDAGDESDDEGESEPIDPDDEDEPEFILIEDDWDPTPENINALPSPVRDYMKGVEAGRAEAEGEYKELERGIRSLLEDRYDDTPYPGPIEAVTLLLEEIDGRTEAEMSMRLRLGAIRGIVSSYNEFGRPVHPDTTLPAEADLVFEVLAEACQRRDELDEQLADVLKRADQTEAHAYSKGRADAEYEAAQVEPSDVVEIRRIVEASRRNTVEMHDGRDTERPANTRFVLADAIDQLDRSRKILYCLLDAMHFRANQDGGNDTADGMAYVLLEEIHALHSLRTRINTHLEVTRQEAAA